VADAEQEHPVPGAHQEHRTSGVQRGALQDLQRTLPRGAHPPAAPCQPAQQAEGQYADESQGQQRLEQRLGIAVGCHGYSASACAGSAERASNSAMSSWATDSSFSSFLRPSVIMYWQKGHALATVSAP